MKLSLLTSAMLLSLSPLVLAAPRNPPPRKVATTQKAKIDARAEQVLERAEKAYRSLRSFSVTANSVEMHQGEESTVNVEIKASLQLPSRAALEMWSQDETGESTPLSKSLITATEYIRSESDERAAVHAINTTAERAKWLRLLLRESPALAFGIGSLAGPRELNPNTKKPINTAASLAKAGILRRLSYANVQDGGRSLLKVTIVLAPPPMAGRKPSAGEQTFEYFFAPRTYWLEKLVIRGTIGGQTRIRTTQFEKPVSNWRGSQSATDAAVYNWKSWAPEIPLSLPRSRKIVSVQPAARQIFERATQVYGKIDRLMLEWTTKESGPRIKGAKVYTSTLAFDREGKIRLYIPGSYNPLVVRDGKTMWSLDTSSVGAGQPAQYSAYPIEAGYEFDSAVDPLYGENAITPFLGDWLSKTNDLDPNEVEMRVKDGQLTEFRAIVLPSQPFNGKPCELVRITSRTDDSNTSDSGVTTTLTTTKQTTLWFARDEGRLLRVQTRSTAGSQPAEVSDILVTKQDVNPVFDAKTFTFVPPKGAVKQKDD